MHDPYEDFHAKTNRPASLGYFAQMDFLPEYKVLNTLVQPDASATIVVDVLHEFNNLTLSLISSDESKTKFLGNHVYYTMGTILEIAARTARVQQSNLVDFVVQLQKQTPTDPNTSKALAIQLYFDDDAVWTELPYLGLNVIENDYVGKYLIPPCCTSFADGNTDCGRNPCLTAEQKRRWENFNAFLARLTAVSDQAYFPPTFRHPLNPLDYSYHAERAFREAFTFEMIEVPADTAIRTACWWFFYAADKLWIKVEKGEKGEDGSLFFTRESWEFWERELRSAKSGSIDGDTQKLIKNALRRMKRVVGESNGKS
jgi:hypothetical protein